MPKMMQQRNKKETLNGVSHHRSMAVRKAVPVSDEDNGSLSFVMISSNNAGTRYNWWEDEYYSEQLDVSGANTERLKTFFKDHIRSVDTAIGKVDNVRVENGELIADVTFGKDDASQAIEQKYRDGILTDVSIGYEIVGYDVQKRENDIDLVTVTDFNIYELSAVGIGFDSGATKREKEDNMPKELLERLSELIAKAERTAEENAEMAKLERMKLDEENADRAKESKDDAAAKKIRVLEEKIAEADRQNEIRSICDEYNASEELRTKFLEKGTADQLRKALLDEKISKEAKTRTYVSANGGMRDEMLGDMADGFAMRMGVKVENASNEAKQFSMASLLDMGRALTGYAGYDKMALAKRTLVTADFPLLLENAGNRILTQNFAEVDATYREWVAEEDVADFRSQTDVTFGNGGELPRIYDGGELNEADAEESGETWNIDSYGRKFTLTRQMLINDDLRALNRLFSEFGITASRTLNAHVYRLLQAQKEYANYKMSDGYGIFNATNHKNVQSLSLDADGLSKGKALMRKQKDLAGNPINLSARYLIVGADLEQTALQLLNSTADLADNKNEGVVNVHYKSVNPIIDNAISGDSWYLAHERRTIKVGYLQGTNRSPVTNIIDTSLLGVTIEGVFDFGVMAEDFRGLVKGK